MSYKDTKESNPESLHTFIQNLKNNIGAAAVAYAYNPHTLGGRGGWISWGQEFKTSLANMVKPHVY